MSSTISNIQCDPTQILKQLAPLVAAGRNSFSVGFALFDRSFRYRFINDALATMNRLPAKAHIGSSVRAILAGSASKVEPMFEKVFSTGDPVLEYEFSGQMPSRKEEAVWRVSYFPIFAAPSVVSQVAVLVLDMTILRRLERRFGELIGSFRPVSRQTCENQPFASLLPPQPAIREAMESSRLAILTNREMEIAKLLVDGKNNKEAGAILRISVRTVESHRSRIMLKLGIHSISELVRIAIQEKIIYA